MKNFLVLLLCLGLIGCTTVITISPYVKTSDIQKVSIGDSFKEVAAKIGQPNQILSKEITTPEEKQTIWLYEAIPLEKCKTGTFDIACPKELPMEQMHKKQLTPPYLIIFADGKVSKIERQKIDATVNVIDKTINKKSKKRKLF